VRKPALIYSADGVTPLVEGDDTEEKLRALAVVCFGAVKGIARIQGQGTVFLEGSELELYRDNVAQKIVSLVGAEMIEKSWGIRLAKEARQ
jgi:hypothetical protein